MVGLNFSTVGFETQLGLSEGSIGVEVGEQGFVGQGNEIDW